MNKTLEWYKAFYDYVSDHHDQVTEYGIEYANEMEG